MFFKNIVAVFLCVIQASISISHIKSLPIKESNEINVELSDNTLISSKKNERFEKVDLSLSYEQMLEDYDYYWEILYENGGFIVTAAKEKGINVEEIKSKYRAMINSQTSLYDFCNIMYHTSRAFEGIGHLRTLSYLLRKEYKADLHRGCSAELIKKSDLLYENYLKSYEFKSLENSTSRVKKIYTINLKNFKIIDPKNKCYLSNDMKTAIIVFDTFKPDNFNNYILLKLSEFRKLYSSISTCDNIILDIRNNGGGYPEVWKKLIVELLSDKQLNYRIYTTYNSGKISKLSYPSYLKNYHSSEYINELEDRRYFHSTLEMYPEINEFFVKYNKSISKSSNSINYNGKIWLLTSQNTYSASDLFASFCKQTGFACIVGTPSNGNGSGGMMPWQWSSFTLPQSGLVIAYFPWMGINLDGSSNAVRGDMPDYYTEEDALEYCLQLIEDGKGLDK